MSDLIKKLLLVLVSGSLLTNSAIARNPHSGDGEKERIVKGNNDFALDLYDNLKIAEGNLFFSPFSISTALAMTYAGARTECAAQMAKVMRFPQGQLHAPLGTMLSEINAQGEKNGYQLNVANALWGQREYCFQQKFLKCLNNDYDAAMHQLDFAGATEESRQTINDWVARKTQEKIKELIRQGMLSPATRLVLTNAIYFKGNWARQFKLRQTREAPFILANKTKKNVPFMQQTAKFKFLRAAGFQALELPYVGDDLAMVIFLPDSFDGLPQLETEFTGKKLSGWLGQMRNQRVRIYLPKFTMSSTFELAQTLRTMGMRLPFSADADFSGMTGKRDLFISEVVHKAFVEVNEEGTEAAAATGVVMRVTAIPAPPQVFRADHPFLFLIRDLRSGIILFMGRMVAPKA